MNQGIHLKSASDMKHKIVDTLWEQLTHGKYTDCRLFAQGKILEAHSVVLSAVSPYLKTLLDVAHQEKNPPIFIFETLSIVSLVHVLRYIYTGAVVVAAHELPGVMGALNLLNISCPLVELPSSEEKEAEAVPDQTTQSSIHNNDEDLNIADKDQTEENIEALTPVQPKKAKKRPPLAEMSVFSFQDSQDSQDSVKKFFKIRTKPSTRKSPTYDTKRDGKGKQKSPMKPTAKPSAKISKLRSMNSMAPSKSRASKAGGLPTCEFCYKEFMSTKSRNRHVKSCKLNPLRVSNICSVCGKELSSPEGLKAHLKLMHKEPKQTEEDQKKGDGSKQSSSTSGN